MHDAILKIDSLPNNQERKHVQAIALFRTCCDIRSKEYNIHVVQETLSFANNTEHQRHTTSATNCCLHGSGQRNGVAHFISLK